MRLNSLVPTILCLALLAAVIGLAFWSERLSRSKLNQLAEIGQPVSEKATAVIKANTGDSTPQPPMMMAEMPGKAKEVLLFKVLDQQPLAALDQPDERVRRSILSRSMIEVDWAALRNIKQNGQGMLEIDLGAKGRLRTEITQVLDNWGGGYSLAGQIAGQPLGTFLATVHGDALVANIRTGNPALGDFVILMNPAGVHEFRELDLSVLPSCDGVAMAPSTKSKASQPLPPPPTKAAPPPEEDGGTISPLADDGSVIDLMVVYTAAARTARGGTSGMVASINQAVNESNTAFTASGVSTSFRLVHSAEVSYSEDSSASIDLKNLRDKADGYMDNVHSLRDTHGADIVSLWTQSPYSGLAGLMTSLSPSFESQAFNVCDVDYATTMYTLTHECGHNLGCSHNQSTIPPPPPGAYSYSYGWNWTGTDGLDYRSIMAYEPGHRVLRFSNPSISFAGAATGTSTADNARTINNTKLTASQWRTATTAPPGVVPILATRAVSNITHTMALSGVTVTNPDAASWSNDLGVVISTAQNPTTSSGTKVRAVDSASFPLLCSLEKLIPSTTYYVRAYAVHSKGTEYGNQVSFTTLPPPAGLAWVQTTPVTDVTHNSAQSGGHVSSSSSAITERGIVFSISPSPTTASIKRAHGSTGNGSFGSTVSTLSPNTRYYVRAYAINSSGTTYGNEVSFTTQPPTFMPPLVGLIDITNIKSTSVTISGEVEHSGGKLIPVTERGVLCHYGNNLNVNNSSYKVNAGGGMGAFTCNVIGLMSGQKYYTRTYAINSAGTAYSSVFEFTTPADVPIVGEVVMGAPYHDSARIDIYTVNYHGGAPVIVKGVVCSTSPYPTFSNGIKPVKVMIGSSTAWEEFTGLTPETTYYVRAYATNSVGTGYGPETTFTTKRALPSTSVILNTYKVAPYSASVDLYVHAGAAPVTERGLVYSTTPDPTFATGTKVPSGSGAASGVSVPISGLTPSTVYYVRGYAVNSFGLAYSASSISPSFLYTEAWRWTNYAGLAGVSGNTNGSGTEAKFAAPWGVAVDSTGNAYVADTYNHAIRKITPGGVVTTFVGMAGTSGSANGTGNAARFDRPKGVAINKTGILFVADLGNKLIRKITPSGVVTTLATLTNDSPTGIAVDSADNVYFTQTHIIRKVDPLGVVSNIAGSSASGSVDGTGSDARFTHPEGLAVDDEGNVYVADTGNHTIRKISPSKQVSTLMGSAGISGAVDGYLSAPRFWNPSGIAFARGFLYVTDQYSTVRKISKTGYNPDFYGSGIFEIKLIGGSYGTYGAQDGLHDEARFANLKGIAAGASGDLFVVDYSSHRVIRGALEQPPQITLPWLSRLYTTHIYTNTAKVMGIVIGDGGSPVTERGTVYALESVDGIVHLNPATELTLQTGTKISAGNGYGTFFCNLTDLDPAGRYRVRNYAINSLGVTYSDTQTITPRGSTGGEGSILIVTSGVTAVTQTSAICGGNVTGSHASQVSQKGIVYSEDPFPTIGSSMKVTTSSGGGTYSLTMNGLKPGVTYYARAYYTAPTNTGYSYIPTHHTFYGQRASFTTEAIPATLPSVTTTATTSVTHNSATTGGNVTNDGGAAVTERGVVYATTQTPTTVTGFKVVSGSGTGSYTSNLTGLNSNTIYYVRAYATNSVGTIYGAQVNLTTQTPPPELPTLSYPTYYDVTENAASMIASVTNGGGVTVTERGVVYATTENPQVGSATKVTSGSGVGSFTSNLTGLNPNTAYYVRAYAINSVGTAYGGQLIFLTAVTPNLIPGSLTVPVIGGSYDFYVGGYGSWNWSKSSGASWVTSSEALNQNGNQTFSYKVAANTTSNSRTAVITVASGARSMTHSITQAGIPPPEQLRLGRLVPAGMETYPDKAGTLALTALGATALSPASGATEQTSLVKPGTIVKVTATAKTGQLFSEWTGLPSGAQVAGNVITFTMPAGAPPVITASFVVNSLPSALGSTTSVIFQGLLRPFGATPAGNDTVGLLTATLATMTGSLTGKVMLDGKATAFNAVVYGNGSGWFKVGAVQVPAFGFLGRNLTLEWSLVDKALRATLNRPAPLAAVSTGVARLPIYSTKLPVDPALLNGVGKKQGYYTMILPPRGQLPFKDAATYPQGNGFATLTLLPAGSFTLTGTLADGTKITAASSLVQGDEAPVFIQLPTPGASTKLGSLISTLSFDASTADHDVIGVDTQWFRPAVTQTTNALTHIYTQGWPEGIELDAMGARYDKTIDAQTLLGLGAADMVNGNTELVFEYGKLGGQVSVKSLNTILSKVVKIPTINNTFTLTLTQATGLISGTFTPNWTQPSKSLPKFQGVLFKKGLNKAAHGFFISNRLSDLDPESGNVRIITP